MSIGRKLPECIENSLGTKLYLVPKVLVAQ